MGELEKLEELWRSGKHDELVKGLAVSSYTVIKDFLQRHVIETRIMSEVISNHPGSEFPKVVEEMARSGAIDAFGIGAIITQLKQDSHGFILNVLDGNPDLAKEVIFSSQSKETSAKIFAAYASVDPEYFESIISNLVQDQRFNIEQIHEKGLLGLVAKIDKAELTERVIEKSDNGYLFFSPEKGHSSLFALGIKSGSTAIHELLETKIHTFVEAIHADKYSDKLSEGVEKCLNVAIQRGSTQKDGQDNDYAQLLSMISGLTPPFTSLDAAMLRGILAMLPPHMLNLIPAHVMNEMNRVVGGYKPTPRYVLEIELDWDTNFNWRYTKYKDFEPHMEEHVNKLAQMAADGKMDAVAEMVQGVEILSSPQESVRARDALLLGLLEKNIDKIEAEGQSNAPDAKKNVEHHGNILHRICLAGSLTGKITLLKLYEDMHKRGAFDASHYLTQRNADNMDVFQCAAICEDLAVRKSLIGCLAAMARSPKEIVGPHTDNVVKGGHHGASQQVRMM